MSEDFEKLINSISGLEKCLENEGVKLEEIRDTRSMYLEGKTGKAYDSFQAYEKYLLVRYETIKRY
jgi:hypothetical protein